MTIFALIALASCKNNKEDVSSVPDTVTSHNESVMSSNNDGYVSENYTSDGHVVSEEISSDHVSSAAANESAVSGATVS